MTPNPHYPGELAYWETVRRSGLVPCKVTAVVQKGQGIKVHFKLTATRGAYKRGEELKDNPWRVIPRTSVRNQGHTKLLMQDFEWCPLENKDAKNSP